MIMAGISTLFAFYTIYNEFKQYRRFINLKRYGFFKSGFLELIDDKARPHDPKFPIHELFPKRMVVYLEVKERVKKNNGDWVWEHNNKLSLKLVPSLDIDIFNEFRNRDADIRFDSAFVVDPETLISHTQAPIIYGKNCEEFPENIQEMVKEYYKDTGKNIIFGDNTSDALVGDIMIRLNIWDDDLYTVFCQSQDGKLVPYNDSQKLFYLSKNPNLLFEDIKLKYDVMWIMRRSEACFLSLLTYGISQLCFWGLNFKEMGLYRLSIRYGPTPVTFLVGFLAFRAYSDSNLYSQGVKKLDALGLRDKNMPESLIAHVSK
ncbi:unnamed protein product [Moneuplotes crassus]|uniref:Uncharacterized protein n=1 Tax=Euplotes crassus TaxID=5936 RepID=A0AAD1UHY1_EUPCR|nr:unnamed protein product [Moneuplotes crassus]